MPAQDTTTAIAQAEQANDGLSEGAVDRQMLIDGRLVAAEHGQRFPSLNPANGTVVGYAPDGTVADAERAIAAARRAFDTTDWSTDVDFRIRCLDQLHGALLEHA